LFEKNGMTYPLNTCWCLRGCTNFPLKKNKKTPLPPAAERGHLANFPCIQGDGTNDGLSSGHMVRFGDWNFGSKLDGLVGDSMR